MSRKRNSKPQVTGIAFITPTNLDRTQDTIDQGRHNMELVPASS